MSRLFIFLFFTITLSACSAMYDPQSNGEAVSIDSLRGAAPYNLSKMQVLVDREVYKRALARDGSVNEARLVEIFHRGVPSEELKEYRLLDVRPGSVYALLGLQHNDVLVAADNFVVPTAPAFWAFLNLIAGFEEATIEVRREGVPLQLQYEFSG